MPKRIEKGTEEPPPQIEELELLIEATELINTQLEEERAEKDNVKGEKERQRK